MVLIEIKQKSQVTIPNELLKKMKLNPGDKLEIEEKDGCLVLTPVVVIPRDQLWFYSPEWQKGEQEAQQQINEGKIRFAKNQEELMKGLGLDEV